MTADRLQDVIGHAHLGKLGDHRVSKIVEAQAVQARLAIPSVAERRSPNTAAHK